MSKERNMYRIFVGIVVALFLVISGIKGCSDFLFSGHKTGDGTHISISIAESRQRGVLVAEFEANPSTFQVNGTNVTISEVWLEERAAKAHFLVWFPYERRTEGYHLCFLAQDEGKKTTRYRFDFLGSVGNVFIKPVPDPTVDRMELREASVSNVDRYPIDVALKRKK